MTKTIDLLHGKIMRSLCILAVPIVMTYFIQMAYNFIDMIWIGRLGSGAVAGVGVAGMFTWFSNGLVMMAKMGGQVKIGHCLGAGDDDDARRYLGAALKLGIVFALFFGIGINILAHSLIGFFHLSSPAVIHDAVLYLRITCGLVIFTFMNQIFTSSFNVYGDSRTPFIMNTCGLVSNVIADPLLIFGIGPFPALGVAGAAVATVFAQMFVFILFIFAIRKRHPLYRGLKLTEPRPFQYYTQIIRIGLPLSLQDMLFSCCSMLIARFVAVYGDGAVAAQKVGTQVESLSWMAADGFMAAINAFISQNYGAGQLSGGMKRRLLFAQAVMGNPKILILDEPTAGLDPNERISLRNLIAREAMDKIVILATHIISDIDCVADHIILMKKGTNRGCKRPEEWMDSVKDKVWEITCDAGQAEEFQSLYNVTAMRQCREGINMRVLSEEDMEAKGWRHCEPTLDEVYLYYSSVQED